MPRCWQISYSSTGTAAVCQSWQWITSGCLPVFHMNSRAALDRKANLATSSAEPYKWPRLKNWSGECGSMKKHLLP